MKLHYMGKYDLNPESIPAKEHKPNAVKFKEPEDSKKLATIATIISVVVLVIFAIPLFLNDLKNAYRALFIGSILSMLVLFPHEIIHAICFKEDVYLFTNLKQGMLFVAGPEDMSKGRYVFMSLLPNIIFGFIPYLLYLINPSSYILGGFAVACISSGAGDYLNVFNALTQMPKGSRTYLHHFNSYWYMPEND